MEDEPIARVRSFNRMVTKTIGALNDDFLGRKRPLGESRLLFEIGLDGAEVRELRSRLGLDSGYMSRMLSSLQQQGLIDVTTSGGDGRVRRAGPTAAGLRELEAIDGLSDEFAATLLARLPSDKRQRLLTAMAEVERLLLSTSVTIELADAASAESQWCLDQYYNELANRFEDGFDVDAATSANPGEMTPPAGVWLLARLDDRPVGCGGLKCLGDGAADIKRMWVDETARGLGVGRRLLESLEAQAPSLGVHTLRLETNRTLDEALGLYRSAGYVEGPRHNDDVYGDHFFTKHLA